MKRILRWIALLALLLLLAATGTGIWLGREIIRPSRRGLEAHHREFLQQPQAHGVRLLPFTASDGTPVIVCEPAASPGPRGIRVRSQLTDRKAPLPRFGTCNRLLVIVHGRRSRKEDMLFIAERFCAAGFRCLVFDLPGHGEHPGELASYGIHEAALPARIAREAATRLQFDLGHAALMGISMGGAVAVRAASIKGHPWRSVVLLCTFDNLASVIEKQAETIAGPMFGSLITLGAGARFAAEIGEPLSAVNSARLASQICCPVLVAHGSADSFIPPQAGRRLHDALTQARSRRWLDVPDAGHATIFTTGYPLFATLAEWLLREVPAAKSPAT